MLNNYLLSDEDYILARYVNIFKKKGILTVKDLLFDFPTKYEDFTVKSINDALTVRQFVNYIKNADMVDKFDGFDIDSYSGTEYI